MSRRAARRGRSGGVQIFTPRSLSGLAPWYRADLLVTQSGTVSAWGDSSGSGDAGKNASQPTAGNRPTFTASSANFAGKPVITGGAGKNLLSGTWAASIPQPYTVFWAAKASTTAEQVLFQGITNNVFVESQLTTKLPSLFAGGTITGATKDMTVAHFGIAVVNGASSAIYISAATADVTGNAGAAAMVDWYIMNVADGGVLPWLGEVAEFGLVNRALGASERAQLFAYATSRYGITVGP